MGNFSITPALVKDLPYQVHKDFQPITQVAASPFIIFINPQLPVKNLAELIAYAKANPKNVYFSSSGNAGLPHMAGEMFNQATGTQMIHVPYKGSAPSITDLMGGQVQLTFEAIAIGLPHLKSGRLKALATTDNKRLTILPDLPAAAETVPGYVVKNWFGLAAPSGIPMDRVLLIQKVVSLVLQDSEVLKTLVDLGVEPIGDSPNQFGALVRQETERWQKLLQNSGIKSD
jgi:tripartite-type tricarboxylate transporter receptor subunit TctC